MIHRISPARVPAERIDWICNWCLNVIATKMPQNATAIFQSGSNYNLKIPNQIWARPKRGIYPQNIPRHGHFNREFWGYPQVPTSSTAASVTASPSLAGQRSSNETGTPGRAFQQTKHGEDTSAEHRKPGLWPTSAEQSGAAQKSPEAPRNWRFQETKTGGSSGCPRKCLVTRVTQSLNCGFSR